MINAEELREKLDNFVEAWNTLEELENEGETQENVCVEVPLDEEYTLCVTFNARFMAIVNSETKEAEMFYDADVDNFTVGDVLGGYLDLTLRD